MSEQIDEALRKELQRQGVWLTSMQELYNWGRKNSIWPLTFACDPRPQAHCDHDDPPDSDCDHT